MSTGEETAATDGRSRLGPRERGSRGARGARRLAGVGLRGARAGPRRPLDARRRPRALGVRPALAHRLDPLLDGGGGRGRARLAADRRGHAPPQPDLHPDDQDDHRAAALRDARGRDRRPPEPAARRADGVEGARLLRGRDHPRPLHRPRRHQLHAGGSRRAGARGAAARGRQRPEADDQRRHPARLPGERREVRGRGAGPADRRVQRPLRGRALAPLRRAAAADARPRGVAGRDHVQVHEPGHALRPGRGGRGDRLHGRPHGPRHPGEPGQGPRHLLPGPLLVPRCSCSCRSPSSRRSRSAGS